MDFPSNLPPTGSIFYFGYLVAQFPATYALQVLPIGKCVSYITIIWGVILMTTPACTSFAGIATNRFLLGLTEAAINPAFVLIMSIWYTSDEQPLRLEAYYCTNGIATMFGGLIGYAIGHITTGLARWMYVFIIFGAASVFWGFVSLVVLPDLPATAKFLTDKEKTIAIDRVSKNKQGVKNRHFRKYQAVQCAKDPKTWILFFMAVAAQVPNSALTSFTSIIINGFGFDTLGSQYLQIPGGAVQFLALIIGGWVCTKWPQTRCITMIVANCVCIIGAGLLVGLSDSNKVSRRCPISSPPPSRQCTLVEEANEEDLDDADGDAVGTTGGALALLFPGPRVFHVPDDDIVQRRRIDQEAAYCCRPIHRLLCWKYHWAADVH